MKKKYPWQAPGYRFSIDWPPGFVPSPLEEKPKYNVQNLRKGRPPPKLGHP